jgi:hypothetical protein
MANEDRISNYVDRTGFASDTKFIIEQLNEALAAFNKLGSVRVGLNGVDSMSKTIPASKEAAAAMDSYEVSVKRVTERIASLNGHSKEFTQVLLADAKAAKEVSIAKLNEAKARETNARAAALEAKASEATTKAKVAEEKATQQTAKAKQIEEKYTAALIKEKEKLNKEAVKEADHLGKLNNQYEQLKAKYLISANTAKQLAAANGINTKETQDAIAVAARYHQQLLKIEQAVGQSQRNVGNYTQATFALTQVLREAPAFANSFATGISAIGNNVPILIDEIKKLNAANVELKANGLKTIPVFSTMVKSIFSLSGILPIAFLALQLFAGALGGAGAGAKKFNKELEDLSTAGERAKDSIKALNEQIEFLLQLSDINIDINFGDFEGSLLKLRTRSVALTDEIYNLDEAIKSLVNRPVDAFDKMMEGVSQSTMLAINDIRTVSDDFIGSLSDGEQVFVRAAKKEAEDLYSLQIELDKKRNQQSLIYANIRLAKADEEKKKAEEERKDALDLFKFRMGLLIEEQKTIVEYSKGNDKRNARAKLADLEIQLAKGVAHFELQQKELTRFAIQKILLQEVDDIRKASLSKKREIELFAIQERQALLEGAEETALQLEEQQKAKDDKKKEDALEHQAQLHEQELENIQQAFDKSENELDQSFARREISEKDYNRKKLTLHTQLQAELLKEDIKYAKAQLDIAIALAKKTGKQEDFDKAVAARQKLTSLELALVKLIADYKIKKNKETDDDDAATFKKKMDRLEKLRGYAQDVFNIMGSFAKAAGDKEKNAIQEQIDLLEKRKQKDIELANQTISNAQERAAAIQVIEARSAAQRDQLDIKKRQAQERQAKFEKAANIAAIIMETSLAVIRALGDKATPSITARIAGAVVVGAIGAAKLAAAIATPIPKYKHGTKDHPGGLAEVGHGKREVAETPDGKMYITPDTPTLVDLPKHTIVHPDADKLLDKLIAKQLYQQSNVSFTDMPVFNDKNITDAIDRNTNTLAKAIRKIPRPIVKYPTPMEQWMKSGSSVNDWLNKNLR